MTISVHSLIRRFLHKENFYNDTLGQLRHVVVTKLRLEDMVHGVLRKIISEMHVSKAAFIFLKDGLVTDVKSEGYVASLSIDDDEIKLLCQAHMPLFQDREKNSVILHILHKLHASIIVQLRTEGKLVGIFLIGEKDSGEYTPVDIAIFQAFSPELAAAVRRAVEYEEVKRFSKALQEEVEKATGDLKNANAKLQDLDKLKDEFVTLASHELRTPMTAIKGSLSTILDGYAGDIPKTARDFLTAAYNENDRLIRLVNNLLNISRIESGKLTFTVAPVDLEALITEVVGNLEIAAKEKDLYLRYEKNGPIPKVIADEDKIREVLINLIGNATKFTHKGGTTIKTQYKDGMIITSVHDTGSGIAKEDWDFLFKKFSQIQGSYAKQSGGTGLGLYICKQIIEGMKGTIWLESDLGIGSIFYFSLPEAV